MDCKEKIYTLFAEIRCFAEGTLSFSVPAELKRKFVPVSFVSGETDAGVLSVFQKVVRKSIQIKETESQDTPGESYKVLIEFQINDLSGDVFSALDATQAMHPVFILRPVSGNRMLIRTQRYGYSLSYEVIEGMIEVSITSICTSGIQVIGE